MTAAHWLMYSKENKINVDCQWDPSHGSWNDVKMAAKDCDVFGFLLGLLLCWNLPHGPWQEDIRSSQVKQMLEGMGSEEWSVPPPLLVARAADILHESGKSGLAASLDVMQ